MPKFPDHPLAVARVRSGLSQAELAKRAGLSRLTVQKIEGAVTRTMDPETARSLEMWLSDTGVQVGYLQRRIDRWFANLDPRWHLGPAQQSLLHLTPAGVTSRFSSFQRWRQAISPSMEFFAALIQVHRRTISDYEKGIRTNGMSSTLAHGLLGLGITDEYLLALRQLPPTEG